MPKREWPVLVVIFSVVVLFAAIVLYPFFHNHFVHPLGRLSRQIVPGQPCSSVDALFADYIENHAVSDQAQFSDDTVTHDLLYTREISPVRALHLYDLSAFDDVQLAVRCDASGFVAESLFIGD